MKRIHIIIGCIIFFVVSGCASNQPDLPTLVVVQTNTPTLTPTDRPTNTPTTTPSLTSTPTPTRTLTMTPSMTPVPSMTSTNTITPTATTTPTDTTTPTPTVTATNVFATINRFDVFPEQALRGEQVVLSWEADADSVRLEVLDQQTNVLDIFLLPPEGEQRVVIPRTVEDLVIFSMTARRLDTLDTLDRPVIVLCEFDWFFDDVRVADEGCPAASAVSGIGAYQRFERGYMLYLPFTRQVYVLYGSDLAGSWVFEPASTSNPIPPAPDDSNLYRPQNQFAPIWLDTDAPSGRSWEDEIGYGVSPAVQTTVLAQDEDRSPVFYLGTANGFVFRFRRDPLQANIGFWERIP